MLGAWGWLSASAHAFCGTYVGPAGEALTNDSSVVVMTYNDGQTVLTMANDFVGTVSDFGLLVPVPAGFQASAVTVVDPAVLEKLDGYSGPRVVSYTCEQVHADQVVRHDSQFQGGCSGGSPPPSQPRSFSPTAVTLGEEDLDEVVVQSYASVGEYELTVVSATGADGLQSWLDAQGFVANPDATAVLQDYVDQGTWFVAAKVAAGTDKAWLSPLQFTFDEPVWSLPLRLGATSSGGVQDLLLYVVGTALQGHAAIQNYPEGVIEDECMVGDPYGDWYSDLVDVALAPVVGTATTSFEESARWTIEYGWSPIGCDPCPEGWALDDATLAALGWQASAADSYLTRLRLRYGAGQVHEDVHLYFTHDFATTQLRYISYDPQLEDIFPICGVGWAENPGTCGPAPDDEPAPAVIEPKPKGGCLCATLPAGVSVSGMVLLVGLLRRRQMTA